MISLLFLPNRCQGETQMQPSKSVRKPGEFVGTSVGLTNVFPYLSMHKDKRMQGKNCSSR